MGWTLPRTPHRTRRVVHERQSQCKQCEHPFVRATCKVPLPYRLQNLLHGKDPLHRERDYHSNMHRPWQTIVEVYQGAGATRAPDCLRRQVHHHLRYEGPDQAYGRHGHQRT